MIIFIINAITVTKNQIQFKSRFSDVLRDVCGPVRNAKGEL